jgi:hypothetical protein
MKIAKGDIYQIEEEGFLHNVEVTNVKNDVVTMKYLDMGNDLVREVDKNLQCQHPNFTRGRCTR